MTTAALVSVQAPQERVYRVAFRPEPWAWPGWQWATNGRFNGRWDDSAGNFRTVYAATSLFACLIEVLAALRPDPDLASAMASITHDEDDDLHPTAPAGQVPYTWLDQRTAGSADLEGSFCHTTAAGSVAALYPRFIDAARLMGRDFDAALLKDASARPVTQRIATEIYATTDLDGVAFASRHGDDLSLWAIFERPGDPATSPRLSNVRDHSLFPEHPDLVAAFGHLGLRWAVD